MMHAASIFGLAACLFAAGHSGAQNAPSPAPAALKAPAASAPIAGGQSAGELQPPARTAGVLPAPECTAPVPGIPIPMDLSRAETLRLTGIRITSSVGQHEARYTVYCTLRCLGEKRQPVTIGLPLLYTPEKGERKLPVSRAVTDIMVSMNDMKVPFALTEGAHPHADSPALGDWATVKHWITATVKPTHDDQVLVYTFTLPLAENGCTAPPLALFRLPYLAAWGGARVQTGTVEVLFSEIYPQDTRHNMQNARITDGGLIIWDFLNNATTDGRNAMRVEVGGSLSPDGKWYESPMHGKKSVRIHTDYTVQTNGTGTTDPMGAPCSAEHLKLPAAGFWKADGTSVPELLLTPARPRRSLALLVRSGLSPAILGTVDPVARNHPETAFSLHPRPSRIRVDINNGEKVYAVKLRDDWQPQAIYLLDTGKPVRSVLLTLEQAYTGSADGACYVQSIEWVDPAS